MIIDKIFQTISTSKPTSQGTDQGLSLAYDLNKNYDVDLTVESVENEFTMFIITLPIT